ncbi:MAG: hypothetical protein HY717_03020 [Planctomycetes bacterium]|nr:hypothetical protein [Planctomycetota bacterium]
MARAGGDSGVDFETRFEVLDTPIEPDAAITGCALSNQYAGPGAPVKAKVTIENLGLAGTAIDAQGQSVLEVEAVFVRENGVEDVVASEPVPELAPGAVRTLEISLEMPHVPVRLRLDPNPFDRDRSNDSRECFFGAPCPRELTCESILRKDEEHTLAIRLSWTDPAIYNEICLYRDGSMFEAEPGNAASFIDQYAPPGQHEYCVRGVRASRSRPRRRAARSLCGRLSAAATSMGTPSRRSPTPSRFWSIFSLAAWIWFAPMRPMPTTPASSRSPLRSGS